MNYENAKTALAVIMNEAEENRKKAEGLGVLLRHAIIEIALHQERKIGDEPRRAELFALYESNRLRLSVGGQRCIVEVLPNPKSSDAERSL